MKQEKFKKLETVSLYNSNAISTLKYRLTFNKLEKTKLKTFNLFFFFFYYYYYYYDYCDFFFSFFFFLTFFLFSFISSSIGIVYNVQGENFLRKTQFQVLAGPV